MQPSSQQDCTSAATHTLVMTLHCPANIGLAAQAALPDTFEHVGLHRMWVAWHCMMEWYSIMHSTRMGIAHRHAPFVQIDTLTYGLQYAAQVLHRAGCLVICGNWRDAGGWKSTSAARGMPLLFAQALWLMTQPHDRANASSLGVGDDRSRVV